MVALVSGALVLALASGSLDSGGPGPLPVVGGQNVATCDFPASVYIGSAGGFNCTASLVHPRVILTAAHCLGNIQVAGFGESAFGGATTVPVQYCEGHPDYYFSGIDMAFCVLAEDAPPVAMAPLIMGCEVDELVPGAEVLLAGFGQDNEATGSGGGVKRWTTNTLDQVSVSANELYLLGNASGSCFGDSGGPAYFQLSDGTWRVIAAVSGPHPSAPPMGCGFGGTYELMHTKVQWIEDTSGIDITPCFDANGTWNPDERCTEFPTAINNVGGSWASGCGPAPVGGPGETCGPPNPDLDTPDPEGGDESGGESDGGDDMGLGTGGNPGHTEGGFDDGAIDDGPVGDDAADDRGESDGSGGDDDDDDPADDGDEPDPGALPAAYGANGEAAGCRVGGRERSRAWWLGLSFAIGFARRRRLRR